MKLHPLQIKILSDLRLTPAGLRYRDMKPEAVENDLYNYHLQYLVKQGFITKEAEYYTLTASGKKQVVEMQPLDLETGESHKFKLAALALLLKIDGDKKELLYQIRGRQPFMGQREIVGGGMQRGEPAVEAAKRRLQEEVGLSAQFSLFGLLRKIRRDGQGHLYSDILYHLCISTKWSGNLVEENEFGQPIWIPLAEAIEIEQSSPSGSPQLAAIFQKLNTDDYQSIPLFYIEDQYTQDIY